MREEEEQARKTLQRRLRRSQDPASVVPSLLLDATYHAKTCSSPGDSPAGSPRYPRCFSIDILQEMLHVERREEEEQRPLSPTSFPSRRPPLSPTSPLIFTVGDYRVSERIGRGAAGPVYLAHHATKASQPPVAIKMVDKNGASHNHNGVLEAKILEQLRHRHINRLVEVKENEHRVCLVLEYAPNGDMIQYLRSLNKTCFSEKEANRIFRQIISAISFVHLNGFAHRDIKPENIYFDATSPQPNAIVGDFSLACEWSPMRRKQRDIAGTFHFSAPETLTGAFSVGPEADIWSCGVLLYFMLTGELAFQAKDSLGVLRKIGQGKWKPVKTSLSAEAIDLISGMLEPNPLRRILMKDIISHPWFSKTEHSAEVMPRKHHHRSQSVDMGKEEVARKKKKTSNLPLQMLSTIVE